MAKQTKVDGRRERSRQTRARIIEAATLLFLDDGYVSTTIDDIAERAGVAVQTVYYVFGTKRNVLAAVLDASVAGDVEPVPVLDRAWVESLEAAPDATSAVEHLVDVTVGILVRATPVYEVVRRAAADPEVNDLLVDIRRRRHDDQRRVVEILRRSGHLGAPLDHDDAADVLYGLMSEEVFQLFTVDCGWSIEQFRTWAIALMLQQLVGSGRALG